MNPDFSSIDIEKAKLINEFINLSKDKKQEELLPLMLAVSSKAKKNNIAFSKEDFDTITSILKKDMSPAEQAQIDNIWKIGQSLL